MKFLKEFAIGLALITIGVVTTGFIYNSSFSEPAFNVGQKVPNIQLKNPEGKVVDLFMIGKKKLVLIDFWASWCGPCRKENPHVVAAYKKYKDTKFSNAPKGFDVYSVSFDTSADSWKKAITQDNLVWTNHVSELLGWRSITGRDYGVNSIPYNVLIDENGNVLAQNLRGANIELTLQKFLK